jgi:hypothetical protein
VARRELLRFVAGLVLVALTLSPAAAAHGGGGALGFRSTVTQVTPSVSGLSVVVLDYDDRLQLRNETGKPLVVLGYQGEPYLAFRDGRVLRNANSPATYLNDDRFGQVELPARADATAAPEWEEVSVREQFDWHDHRIHWMSETLPPKVREARDRTHHVFEWAVPARLDGDPLTIAGSLDYEPPPDGVPYPLVAVLGLLVLGGGAAVLLRWRRARHGQ